MNKIFADAKTAGEGVLTRAELFAALSRCMAEHPPEGLEKAMHPDADRMAGLWAVMHLENIETVPLANVKPQVLQAFGNWQAGAAKPQQGGSHE